MNYGIIAAGEGSRLCSEGVESPKPLVRINGMPMIERLLRIFDHCRAESVAVIVNGQTTEVKEYLEALKPQLDFPLYIKVKSTPSSMHSFYELSDIFRGSGKFVLTTVDTIFRSDDFERYVKAFDELGDDYAGMMGVTSYIDDEKPLYVSTDANNDITGFLDENAPDIKFISGGIYGLTDPAVDILEDCIASGVSRMRNFQRALVAGGLKLKAFDLGKILDVDHASDIVKAEAFVKS